MRVGTQTVDVVSHDGKDGTARPMRVAYVVCTFETGGLERCIARLCSHLDRDRFRPMVVCLSRSGAAADWIERDDVPIVELGKRAGNDPLLVRRLARTLKEDRVDVVHSHNWGRLVETSLARRWAGVPVHVHAERGTLMGDLNGGGLRSRLRAAVAAWRLMRAARSRIDPKDPHSGRRMILGQRWPATDSRPRTGAARRPNAVQMARRGCSGTGWTTSCALAHTTTRRR